MSHRRLCGLLLLVMASPSGALAILSRRAAIMLPAAITAVPKPAHASLAHLGVAAKRRRQEQEQCFDAMECAEAVPAYDITCERDDSECLQRRQALARQELANFRDNPGGAVGVVALLTLRPILSLFRGRAGPGGSGSE